jgi:hypothetical protein
LRARVGAGSSSEVFAQTRLPGQLRELASQPPAKRCTSPRNSIRTILMHRIELAEQEAKTEVEKKAEAEEEAFGNDEV